MGLPPAHAKTMSVVVNPEPRRWLSHFFCGHYVQDQKKRDSWQLVPKFHLGTQSLLKFYFPFCIGPASVIWRSTMVAK
jgi:hypothetical protein